MERTSAHTIARTFTEKAYDREGWGLQDSEPHDIDAHTTAWCVLHRDGDWQQWFLLDVSFDTPSGHWTDMLAVRHLYAGENYTVEWHGRPRLWFDITPEYRFAAETWFVTWCSGIAAADWEASGNAEFTADHNLANAIRWRAEAVAKGADLTYLTDPDLKDKQ